MDCERCHGLMAVDHFLDLADQEGRLWLRVWRCLNCGWVTEPGILRNRTSAPPRLARLLDRLTGKPRRAPSHRGEVVALGT